MKLVSQKRRGIMFDGSSSYIEIANPFSNVETFTISAWIKPSNINKSYQAIIGNNGVKYSWQPSLWVAPNGGLHYDSYSEAGIRFNGIMDKFFDANDSWIHVAWVKEGKKYMFYKNGVLFDTKDAPEEFYIEKKKAYQIGKIDNYFTGQIAEVCIWDHALTASYIKNNMYLQLRGTELGLLGYWRLGGIYENKVFDFSENGNDGKVYGNAYVGAITLKRNLAANQPAVKYSNADLFAVSQRATYQESFEFKVNGIHNLWKRKAKRHWMK